MTLSEFIERDVERLVNDWLSFACAELDSARGLSPEALRDDVSGLLLSVADDVSHPRAGAPAPSPRTDPATALKETARRHAQSRFDAGFTLYELIAEYRAARANVVRLWTGQDARLAGPDALAELVRFDDAIDRALTASISWYGTRVEEARGLLLGVLGHDLRTPLGAVRNSAIYLVRSDGLTGAQTKAVGRILAGTERMREMIDDLLDFTRTRLGRGMPIEPRPTDLADLAGDVVDELQAFHPERQLRLECTGSLDGRWDPSRLKQLLSNLASNAIHHGESDAPVTLAARGERDRVVVTVHNLGPPIPPDALGVLFEPMARAALQAPGRREGSSGLGLGLYIARQIAVAHGGAIEVESTADEGTTFTLRLPRRPKPAAERPAGAG